MAVVKTAISLPEELFASLEALAVRSGKSRSAVVAEAVLAMVEREESLALASEWNAIAAIEAAEQREPGESRRRRVIARHSRLLDELGYVWEE